MSLERRVALVTAFEAGFRAALESADLYDRERGRLGRALTDDEIRRLAEFWVYPIRVVSGTNQPPSRGPSGGSE